MPVTLEAQEGVTIQAGGVYKFGRLVVVELRLQLATNKSGILVKGLPIPIVPAYYNTVTTANNKIADIGVTTAGYIQTNGTISAGVLILSTTYISAS